MYALRVADNRPPDLQSILARVAELEAELKRKDQIIEALQKRLFGSSSERLDPAQLQLEFDDSVLGKPAAPPETGDEERAPEEPAKNAKRSRRKKADLFPENLAVVIEAVIIPEDVEAHPEQFKEIGEEHHDELDVTRASMFWRRTVRKKFVSKQDRSQAPIVAPAPEPSLPGTLCAPGLAAQIVVDKYCDHLPHYRQEKRLLRQHGAKLGRQTLNTWTHAVARHLAPIGEAIKGELFHARSLQVDETPIAYLSPGHGQTKNGYLWVYRDSGSDRANIHDQDGGTVYYHWQTGRSADCLKDIIRVDEQTKTTEFEGIIQCDGYSAYQALAKRYRGIKLAGCLAHMRRKFYESREQAPQVVQPILRAIQKLYRIERYLKLRDQKVPPECRMLVRLGHSRAIADELYQRILNERQHGQHLPKSKLGEALDYALRQWARFEINLTTGGLELDTNLVENAIRPTKLGAKNYLFFGSVRSRREQRAALHPHRELQAPAARSGNLPCRGDQTPSRTSRSRTSRRTHTASHRHRPPLLRRAEKRRRVKAEKLGTLTLKASESKIKPVSTATSCSTTRSELALPERRALHARTACNGRHQCARQ